MLDVYKLLNKRQNILDSERSEEAGGSTMVYIFFLYIL